MIRKSLMIAGALLALSSGPVLAAADLVPDAGDLLTSGEAAVTNNGDAASTPTQLVILCKKTSGGGGGCAEDPGMAAYTNPAYPNAVVIEVPALNPGETFEHTLAFWDALVWPVGTFKLSMTADAGKAVAEDNERNNFISTKKTQLGLNGVAPQPPLTLTAKP